MSVSLGDMLGLIADLLALQDVDGFRESSQRLIDRLIQEAEHKRVRRKKGGRDRPRASTCGQYCDGGRRGGAPRVTVTVRPSR
ncbi:MAG: hypothetical protein K6E40_04645 [Desulfovibrio sp.]|nr:hypothetical protein [Desulfovibrio sp.]